MTGTSRCAQLRGSSSKSWGSVNHHHRARGPTLCRIATTLLSLVWTMKLLICGDARGKLDVLFARVNKLNKSAHGPFDLLLCVGEFAAADGTAAQLDEYASGAAKVPLPTYFVVGQKALAAASAKAGEAAGEDGSVKVADNLTFLGWAGIADVMGFKIAFLSGKYDPLAFRDARAPDHAGAYHQEDVSCVPWQRWAFALA